MSLEDDQMHTAPLIQFNDARVRRDGRVICQVDHLEIMQGEHVAILGPNGAGKSTLVSMITRDVLPLHTEPPAVLWLGVPRIETAELKRLCGVVSSVQQWILDAHLSVQEVVLGGLFGALTVPRWIELSEDHIFAADRAIREVGLVGMNDRDMTTLSTGEARRVAVARAIVHDPTVLILDEPTAGLDPTAAFALRDTMRLVCNAGRTLVLVTHHVEDIVDPIDRIVLVKDSHVIADGDKASLLTDDTLSDLYDIPVTLEQRDGEYRMW